MSSAEQRLRALAELAASSTDAAQRAARLHELGEALAEHGAAQHSRAAISRSVLVANAAEVGGGDGAAVRLASTGGVGPGKEGAGAPGPAAAVSTRSGGVRSWREAGRSAGVASRAGAGAGVHRRLCLRKQ